MEIWRRHLEHLRHEARNARDGAMLHKCLAAGRIELLTDPHNVGRYTAVPYQLDDQYLMGGLIWFMIATPATAEPYVNCLGDDDMRFRSVSFNRREPLILEENLALHLAAALNAGMLGSFL